MTRAWSEFFIEMPLLWDLCLRLSVVLIVAWGLHAALARCNPRWRVQLWRFTSIAVLIVMAATCLPKIAVLVEQQVAAVEPVVEEPSLVTMSQPMLRGAGTVGDISKLPSIGSETEFPLDPFIPAEEAATTSVAIPAEPPQETATSSWVKWLLASVWAAGASLLAVRWTAAQLGIRNLLSRTTPAPKQSARLLRSVADRLDIFGDFDLRLSTETDVPFVAGLLRPIVVLPARMAEQQFAPELPAIFAHELTHVKSRDLIWMGISQWITIPLWFHPLTWRATSAHSMACEEVADAVAADNVGDVARYSGTLARVALAAVSHPPATAAISMARSSQIMSRLARLKRGLSNTPLARRWVILSALTGLLAVLPLATIKLAYADNESATATTSNNQTGRVLHFPKKQSVGVLYFATEKELEWWDTYFKRFDYRRDWDWKYLGQAQGDVELPPGAQVKLEIKKAGAANTSWITKLRPDDLYEVYVYPHPGNGDSYRFGNAQARHLGHLTGLTELTIQFTQVTGPGLRALKPLHKLEKLMYFSEQADNDSLRSIGELTSLETLSLGKAKWDDAGLAHLSNLDQLTELNLPFAGIPGRGFDAVLQLPNLKFISGGVFFKNAHLARLKKSKSLEALDLSSNTLIDDDSMKYVAQLPQLKYLNLWHTNINDAGVKHLRPLTSLKRLKLMVSRQSDRPRITSAGVTALSEMSSLEVLDFADVGDPDGVLEQISKLKNLKSVSIGGRRDTGFISDAGLKHLAKLTKLERLTAYGSEFTDVGAAGLAKLSGLKWLSLQTNGITDDGLAQLAALNELRYLSLYSDNKNAGITFQGVSRLNGLTNLTELWYQGQMRPAPGEQGLDFSGMPALEKLGMNGLRDEDIVGLKNCNNLKWLQGSSLTNAGVADLAGFRKMERLTITGEEITDDALVHLGDMPKLNMLTVNAPITDEGLKEIENIKSLEYLTVETTNRLSPAAVRSVQTNLPTLRRISINDNRASVKRTKKKSLRFGQDAPPFELTSLDGTKLSLENQRGKVVLLYFWSTNCKPCVASMPKLKKAYAELSAYQDFAMIGLSGDENDSIWKEFIRKQKLTWPQVRIGDKSKMAAAYGVTGYPKYILIGRDGKILATNAGAVGGALKKALEVDGE